VTRIDHPAIIRRLKRADGHLQKIIEMMGTGSPCLHLAQQLQAVEGAIENAKKTLIHDYLSRCLQDSFKNARPAARITIQEFESIARYL
jgi:uncharacterized protein